MALPPFYKSFTAVSACKERKIRAKGFVAIGTQRLEFCPGLDGVSLQPNHTTFNSAYCQMIPRRQQGKLSRTGSPQDADRNDSAQGCMSRLWSSQWKNIRRGVL